MIFHVVLSCILDKSCLINVKNKKCNYVAVNSSQKFLHQYLNVESLSILTKAYSNIKMPIHSYNLLQNEENNN